MRKRIRSWDARTSERDQFFHGGVITRYNSVLPFVTGKEVLDIGSGLGFGTNYIASNGARKVLGIDHSEAAIEHAKNSFSLPNIEFRVMDATNLLLPEKSFDVVTAFEIIEHLPVERRANFLNGISRVLKREGICFISTSPNKALISFGPLSKPANPYHTQEFGAHELFECLHKYFSKVSIKGIRCINKDYVKIEQRINKSFKHRMICLIGRSRLVREVSTLFFPPEFRKKITSEDRLPQTTLSDFEICDNAEICDDLIALCRC